MDLNFNSWTIDAPSSSSSAVVYETASASTLSSPPPPPSPGEDDVPFIAVEPPSSYGDESDDHRLPSSPPHLGREYITRASRWYTPDMPPPRVIDDQPRQTGAQAQDPIYVPMPPGPTVVQIPLFDTLMAILREHRMAQLATVDQQRELIRYMGGLNDWFARDVQDRQAELRGVIARVDQLREDLNRLVVGVAPAEPIPQPQTAGQGAGGYVVPPPVVGAPVPAVAPIGYPAGFVPQAFPQPPVRPEIEQLPHRHYPIIPEPLRWDTPDSSQYDGRMGPAEMPHEYSTPGISFVTIMHTLAVIISIVLALAAFFRTGPIQIRCQYDLSRVVESPTSIAGSAYSHGTVEGASCYSDRLNAASVGVQEGLSDAIVTSIGGPAITHAGSCDVAPSFAGSRFPVIASTSSTAIAATNVHSIPPTGPSVLTMLVTVVGGTLFGAWLTCQNNKRTCSCQLKGEGAQ